ncbi:MAG TPA: iron-containing alcohol dehydrogenase [Alphaproteobacteria bacterium]|nr:iron-containing alcohol dehydrogenase [Alphaproteobacteria bacterium]
MISNFTAEPGPRIAFGANRVDRLGEDVERLAGPRARVLLVTDPGLIAASVAGRVQRILDDAGHVAVVFSELSGEPQARQIDGAAALARESKSQLVVGLGGGSALDTAKLAAAAAAANAPVRHYELSANPLPADGLIRICVPTTAGTGSEATRTSVFANAGGAKVWAWGAELKPHLSLLDPTLSMGLPERLTAATGVDALVHAIEAVTIRRANPLNDANGLQAIRLVTRYLKRAVETPQDLEARGAMLIAACLAGLAIDGSGTGIAHAIGHALGTVGHIHHGRAVGLSLRVALAWNAEAAPGRHAAVAEAMGIARQGRSDRELAAALAPAYDAFVRSIGLPIALASDGLGETDAERLAEVTMSVENEPMRKANCRDITPADAERFAREVLTAA